MRVCVCKSRVESKVVVFEERVERGSAFVGLGVLAGLRFGGGRRGGRVLFR